MILGLLDYWQYQTRRGRFSSGSMEDADWSRSDLITITAHEYRLGDIAVFSPSASVTSWAIMYVTNSVVSHVAVVTDVNGQLVEATTDGAVTSHMWGHTDDEGWFRTGAPPGLTNEQRRRVAEAAKTMVGTPYNWAALPRIFMRELLGLRGSHHSWRLQVDALLTLALIATGLLRGHSTLATPTQ